MTENEKSTLVELLQKADARAEHAEAQVVSLTKNLEDSRARNRELVRKLDEKSVWDGPTNFLSSLIGPATVAAVVLGIVYVAGRSFISWWEAPPKPVPPPYCYVKQETRVALDESGNYITVSQIPKRYLENTRVYLKQRYKDDDRDLGAFNSIDDALVAAQKINCPIQ